ncbi:MAG: hypothetical protein F6K19_17680 [Cyanothece sp. SIO1E1]|nr:hypothetical protein [Cyanothece sp. SIO1E1]
MGANLGSAVLNGVNFERAVLEAANLKAAVLNGVNFRDISLKAVKFSSRAQLQNLAAPLSELQLLEVIFEDK